MVVEPNVMGEVLCQPAKVLTEGFPLAVVPMFSLSGVARTSRKELTDMVRLAEVAVAGETQTSDEGVTTTVTTSPFTNVEVVKVEAASPVTATPFVLH